VLSEEKYEEIVRMKGKPAAAESEHHHES